jgi:hypothetical protein
VGLWVMVCGQGLYLSRGGVGAWALRRREGFRRGAVPLGYWLTMGGGGGSSAPTEHRFRWADTATCFLSATLAPPFNPHPHSPVAAARTCASHVPHHPPLITPYLPPAAAAATAPPASPPTATTSLPAMTCSWVPPRVPMPRRAPTGAAPTTCPPAQMPPLWRCGAGWRSTRAGPSPGPHTCRCVGAGVCICGVGVGVCGVGCVYMWGRGCVHVGAGVCMRGRRGFNHVQMMCGKHDAPCLHMRWLVFPARHPFCSHA